jgi:hypothetical protein
VTTPAAGAHPTSCHRHAVAAKPGDPPKSAGGARNLGGHSSDRRPCARTSQPEFLAHAARDAHHDEPSPVFSQRLRWSGPAVGLGGLEPPASSLSAEVVTAVRTAVRAGRSRPSRPEVCVQPANWYALSAQRLGLAWRHDDPEGRRRDRTRPLRPRARPNPALDRAGDRRLTLARRQRGAQLGDRAVQLVERAVREDATDAGVELGRD